MGGRREYVGLAALSMIMLGLILAVVTWAAGPSGQFNDFHREAWPAYQALFHGHVVLFVQRGPAYIGSLVLRAPFALVASLWGGGWRAVFVATALPCLAALPILLSWILYERRRADPTPSAVWTMLVGTLTPALFMAIFGGHPEDVLGAVLCVASVLTALQNRRTWCTVLLTLAIINKPWALAALPVVLIALPAHRVRTGLTIVVLAGAVLGGLLAIQQSVTGASAASLTGTGVGTIFNPGQLLWWFGRSSWLVVHARILIVLLPFLIAGLWWRRQRSAVEKPAPERILLLLVLVLLLRAALDPWDNLYYNFPFLLALLAYEAHVRRLPVLSIIYSVLLVFIAPVRGVAALGLIVPARFLTHPSAGLQAAAYALVMVPTLIWLVSRLYVGQAPATGPSGRSRGSDGAAAISWRSKRSEGSPQRL